MDVSIIICTHNGADALGGTLESLRRIDVPSGQDVELLLVDNASTDRTPDVISEFEHPLITIRSLCEPKPGKSRALNRSIRQAAGDVLLFTDDDVRFPSDWIEAMSRPILEGETDAVAGGVQLAPELEQPWMSPWHKFILGSTESIPLSEDDQFFGANMAVSKIVFDKISGYDERLGPGGEGLGSAEDTLLAWQLREAAFHIRGRPDVTVEHHPDPSLIRPSSFRARTEGLGRSEAYISYHWEHRRWPIWKLYAGWVYYQIRLIVLNLQSKSAVPEGIDMSKKEFEVRRRMARIHQHLRERGTPPKYHKRGTMKKNGR